jgi:hypothetical protein
VKEGSKQAFMSFEVSNHESTALSIVSTSEKRGAKAINQEGKECLMT